MIYLLAVLIRLRSIRLLRIALAIAASLLWLAAFHAGLFSAGSER